MNPVERLETVVNPLLLLGTFSVAVSLWLS
jgi:hypothetical protein